MSLLNGCISSAEVDSAVDFRAIEDDEHQIRSIFSNAIHLKNEVRSLSNKLAEYELATQKLHRMIRERDMKILQLEMGREEEYDSQVKEFKAKTAESTRARAEMKRQLNNAANETMLANNVIQGMPSRIKALEEEVASKQRPYRETTAEKACQTTDKRTVVENEYQHPNSNEQLHALRASTTKLIAAVKQLSRKGNLL